jgi:flavin reductase (DIM6/NTAB) family NADH-FMN oxidoreductase RutF
MGYRMLIDGPLDLPLPELDEQGVQEYLRFAMRRLVSTVGIVTTNAGDVMHGTTVTAMASLSLDPPAILVCLNKETRLSKLMADQKHFCVNLLHSDNAAAARAFSQNLSSEQRFTLGDWRLNADELPYLANAQANLFCVKDGTLPYGSHVIFIGRVTDIRVRTDVNPLLYADGNYTGLCVGSSRRDQLLSGR